MRSFVTLFLVLIISVVGFSQVKYTYVGGSGNWQTPSKWSPAGVPGIADTAVINFGTLTNDSTVFVASLFHNGGTINGTGEINITDSLSFISGILSGTGAIKLLGGCNGVISGGTLSRSLTNEGNLTWQGNTVTFSNGAVFTNNGTFDVKAQLSQFGFGGGGSIINNGSIIRSTATETAIIAAPISNQGIIHVKSGILRSVTDVTGNGSFIIDPGTFYVLSGGAHTLVGNNISGGGIFELNNNTLTISTGNVIVQSGTTFLQSGGTITGDDDLIIEGQFDFKNGIQSGNGTTKISTAGTCLAGGTQGKQFSRNFLNNGIFTWNGGNITFGASKTFINNGTFNAEVESGSLNNLGGVSIVNNGIFNRSTGSANLTIAPKFINNNELNILNGSISFNDSLINNATGKIKGVGILTMPSLNKLLNKGIVEPGNDVGVLQFNGYYSQTSDASLKIEIGGYAAGTERDSISVVGAAMLNGELNIQFINNFIPQDGDEFPLMSYTSRTGEFTQLNFSNNVIGYIQYNSNGAQIVIGDPSSVGEESDFNNIPDTYDLAQNYPNPFNPSTKISWQSPVGSHQTLKIYDMLGNEVATLVNECREAGRYEVTFDGSNLASGMYLYRLQSGSFVETKKMILIK